MSTTMKSVIVIVALGVLALIAVVAFKPNPSTNTAESVLPSGTDTTDAALAEDTAAIDANLEGLSTDQVEVDQGINGHVAP